MQYYPLLDLILQILTLFVIFISKVLLATTNNKVLLAIATGKLHPLFYPSMLGLIS